jgi:hypothetical protein
MNFEIAYKTLKYFSCGIMMFLILKYVVNDSMTMTDILLISIISMLIFAIVENGYSLVNGKNDKNDKKNNEDKLLENGQKTEMCKSFCEMKEHMENMGPINTEPNNIEPINTEPDNMGPSMVNPNISENDSMNSEINNAKMQMLMQQQEEQEDKQTQSMMPSVYSEEDGMDNYNQMKQIPEMSQVTQEMEYVRIPKVSQEMEYVRIPKVSQEMAYAKVPKVSQENGVKSDYDRFQKRFAEIIEERKQHNDDYIIKTGKIDRNSDASYTVNVQRRGPDMTSSGWRGRDGPMKESEMKYDVVSYHTVPPNLNTGSFEYGYSFLPPKDWYPTPPFPPVCVTEKQCPVCPVYTSGTNVDLKEWDSARRVTAPDEINVRYVEEKLNSGR